MGGRGTRSHHARQTAEPIPDIERNYEMIARESLQGQASYALLERTGRNWTVLTSAARDPGQYDASDTFGMEHPTLRWVNGDQIVDVYVDGMDTSAFLEATGLDLSLHKGGFVLSKRLSRILRPQYATGFFDADKVSIHYMEQDAFDAKVWDGAGLISRSMMTRMIEQLPEVGPAKRAQLIRELKHGQRVEFTIMSASGQDKGHAIVSDTIEHDFVLPQDTKREVKLMGGQTFVGINFVHGHADMRLDIQSLINMHPFFEPRQLATWLHQEGELFAQSIETGEVGAAMARIDKHTSREDVEAWPLREFLASGGAPMWFGSHVKSFANQHLERLNHATLNKMRLPIPGGRYYVMPAGVGEAADLDIAVGRGEIFIDHERGTAWVNDEDWVQFEGSHEGIAGILGGADNDDALWTHGFTDHDGQRKVLAWRSPNQGGEYVILKPTADSDDLVWHTPQGEIAYPPADSRKLMPRIDTVEPDYLSLIDERTAGGLGEGEAYSIDVMGATIERAIANQGALGAYCNSLMLTKAIYDRLPERPPAPLEDVIDGSVKIGTDLSPVLDWTQFAAQCIRETQTPVPGILEDRLGPSAPGTPAASISTEHWLDELTNEVRAHIAHMSEQRDALVQQTTLPRAVFDHAFAQPATIKLGAKFNQTYTRAIKRQAQAKDALTAEDYDAARGEAEAFLFDFSEPMQRAILRGAMVSAALREAPGSDAAVWLAGAKSEGKRTPGIGHRSVEALREIGVLDEIAEVDEGLVSYPPASVPETPYKTIGIHGVWQNLIGEDQPSPEAIRRAKAEVKAWAESGEALSLDVRDESVKGQPRKVAYHRDGRRFGTLSRDSADHVGTSLTIRYAIAHDGNLRAVIETDEL